MSDNRSGVVSQTGIYLKQCFSGFMNDNGWKSFISVVIITFLIVCVMGEDTFQRYADTKNGAFALVCACIWVGIFSSIRSICRERDIVKHEHRTGLKMVSYVMAHWIYEAALCFVDAIIITVIVVIACIGHLPENGVFAPPVLELFITFFLVVFSADALGLLISATVRSENTAMTVMPFALIIQLVMSGQLFKLEGIPDLISYLTISRWGLDAICSTSHVNEMLEAAFDSTMVLSECAASLSNLAGLWLTLAGFAVIYAILSIVILEFTIDR